MHFSVFFDHSPTYGYVLVNILLIIYVIKVCNSYILLTTHLPLWHNVICEGPLEGLFERSPASRTERDLHLVLLAGALLLSPSDWNKKIEAQDFRYKLISTLGSYI